MNQPIVWYPPGYSELSFFEMILTGFLFVFILIKKDKLVIVFLGAKLIIHHLVAGDIFWVMSSPEIFSAKTYLPLLLKQIIYIVILIWMIYSERKKNYKQVLFGIILLFCIELFSSFVYYPIFMESVMRNCPDCITHLSRGQMMRQIAYIAAAPFTQIKNRLLFTFIEVIVFFIQYLLYRKDKTALNDES